MTTMIVLGIRWTNLKLVLRKLDVNAWQDCIIRRTEIDKKPVIVFECTNASRSCQSNFIWEQHLHWTTCIAQSATQWTLAARMTDLLELLSRAPDQFLEWSRHDSVKQCIVGKSYYESSDNAEHQQTSWEWPCVGVPTPKPSLVPLVPYSASTRHAFAPWSWHVTIDNPTFFQSIMSHFAIVDPFIHIHCTLAKERLTDTQDWLIMQSVAPRCELQYALPLSRFPESPNHKPPTVKSPVQAGKSSPPAADPLNPSRRSLSVRRRTSAQLAFEEAQALKLANERKHSDVSKSRRWLCGERIVFSDGKRVDTKPPKTNDMWSRSFYERFRPETQEWMSPDTWIRHEFSIADIESMVKSPTNSQPLWQRVLAEGGHVNPSCTKVTLAEFEYGAKSASQTQVMDLYKQRFPSIVDQQSVTQTRWHQTEPLCRLHQPRLPIHPLMSVRFQILLATLRLKQTRSSLDPDLCARYPFAKTALYASTHDGIEYHDKCFEWRDILLVARDCNASANLVLVQRILPASPKLVSQYSCVVAVKCFKDKVKSSVYKLYVLTDEAFFFTMGVASRLPIVTVNGDTKLKKRRIQ